MQSKFVGMGLATLGLMGGGCRAEISATANATARTPATPAPYAIDMMCGAHYARAIRHITDRGTGKIHVMASYRDGGGLSWVKIDEFTPKPEAGGP